MLGAFQIILGLDGAGFRMLLVAWRRQHIGIGAQLGSARFGPGPDWLGSARLGLGPVRPGTAQIGSARLGPDPGSARLGSARLGPARPGPARLGSARQLAVEKK